LLSGLSIAFFLIHYFFFAPILTLPELKARAYVAFVEEMLIRLFPFLLLYIKFPKGNFKERILFGLAAGSLIASMEIATKVIALGKFEYLMLMPAVYIHLFNAMLVSVVVGEAIENKEYVLIPIIYIVASLYHFVWNIGFGFL